MFPSSFVTRNACFLRVGRPLRALGSFSVKPHYWRTSRCLGPILRRAESSAAAQARQPNSFVYPESVNVFIASGTQSALYGIMRVCVTGVFLVGVFGFAPGCYFNPDASNWWVPACILISPIPMALSLLWGPMVTSIRVYLPQHARRSRDALRTFVTQPPANTRLAVTFLRFRPWPIRKLMYLSELRRTPFSLSQRANMELVRPEMEEAMERHWLSAWFVRKYFALYWVPVESNRVREGDVFEKLWQSMPIRGERSSSQQTNGQSKRPHSVTAGRNLMPPPPMPRVKTIPPLLPRKGPRKSNSQTRVR